MKYTALTKRALKLCFKAHKDQVDKSGMPYVFHPFHLAEQMDTEDEICVALLHDVVEDTDYTLEDLRSEGFPESVLEAVQLMTHEEGVPYMDYVDSLAHNPIARKVKLADLAHNSDVGRLDTMDSKVELRLEKYAAAKRFLEVCQAHDA